MSDQGSNFGGSNVGAGNGRVADRLHNVVDQATDRASDVYSRARTSVDGWLRDLGAMMERRPVATIFIGISIGYILAKLRGRD
jgi:hypothetical protein